MRGNLKTITFYISFVIFISGAVHTQWTQTSGTPEGAGITDMVVTSNGTVVVTCASFNFPNGQFGGIRHSTNSGATWQNDFQHYTARTLALGQNDVVFASSWNYPTTTEGLYKGSNHGTSWSGYSYLLGTGNNIFSILVRDNNQTVYLGTRTGVLKSTNGGSSFSTVNNGIPANSWVRDLEADSEGNIAAATTNGVFISTNSAASWVQATGIPSNDTVTTLNFVSVDTFTGGIDIRLYAGTNKGNVFEARLVQIYVQFMFLNNFPEVSIIDFYSLTIVPHFIRYLCARKQGLDNISDPGIYLSNNNGSSWTPVSEGLPSNPLVSAITGYYPGGNNYNLYAGLFENSNNGAKVFRRTLPIGIQKISNEIPQSFSLFQNYPNPFNPSTKIRFNVPQQSDVKLNIFDVLGRHVIKLVNQELKTGTYETEWNAYDIPSGIYFYRIEAEGFTETKKMILVK